MLAEAAAEKAKAEELERQRKAQAEAEEKARRDKENAERLEREAKEKAERDMREAANYIRHSHCRIGLDQTGDSRRAEFHPDR